MDQDDWSLKQVMKASAFGYISGFRDRTFRPEENITRQQALVAISSGQGYPDNEENLVGNEHMIIRNKYQDSQKVADWAVEQLAALDARWTRGTRTIGGDDLSEEEYMDTVGIPNHTPKGETAPLNPWGLLEPKRDLTREGAAKFIFEAVEGVETKHAPDTPSNLNLSGLHFFDTLFGQ
jgi:hypothetical protein